MTFVPAPSLGKTIIDACKRIRIERQQFTWDIIAKKAKNAVQSKEWEIKPIYKTKQ